MTTWYKDPIGTALNVYGGVFNVRKFGDNTNIGTATVPEDIWNGGGLWVAPTEARVHSIVSTEIADTQTVRISGLTGWDLREEHEDVVLDGTTPVNTTKSWVIIHRMCCTTGGINTGAVTATAATDATVTAQIDANAGQTSMFIYGVGGGHKLIITGTVFGGTQTQTHGYAEILLQINDNPADGLTEFRTIGRRTANMQSTSVVSLPFARVPLVISGPAIVKAQVSDVGGNDTSVFGEFYGHVVQV